MDRIDRSGRSGRRRGLGIAHVTPDLRRHFLHKGKGMKVRPLEVSPNITRQRERVHECVLRNIEVSVKGLRPKRVLDVGTGYGTNLTFLVTRFGRRARIWSVDASPAIVREIKKMMSDRRYSRHVVIKQADAEHLPFPRKHFDLIVSSFSLHHLSNPERGLFEMGRVLADGGKLIIADWTPAAGKPLLLHAPADFPSPTFVNTQLKRSGYRTKNRKRRYWYLIEAVKCESLTTLG